MASSYKLVLNTLLLIIICWSSGVFAQEPVTSGVIENGTEAPEEELTIPPDLYDYDYDYDYSQDISIRFIRKCQCSATELLDGGKCVEHPMLLEAVNSSPPNVTVEDIICPPNLSSVVLPHTLYTGLAGGSIMVPDLDIELGLSDYCIEYLYNENGEITIEAKVCLAPPSLPVCCPGGQTLSILKDESQSIACQNQGETLRNIGNSLTPQMFIGDVGISWDGMTSHESPVSCELGHNLTSSIIGSEHEASLGYSISGAYLMWDTPNKRRVILPTENFCVQDTGDRYEAHFCYQNPLHVHTNTCQGKVCVRKCCTESEVYFGAVGCIGVNHTNDWTFQVYDKTTMVPITNEHTNASVVSGFTIVYGGPICSNFYALDSDVDPFILLDSGELFVLSYGKSYPASRYCIDNILDNEDNIKSLALVCFPEMEENLCFWQKIVQVVALGLSCVFIIGTLFVYLSVTEICKRLPSKCVVSQSVALLVSFLCLIILQSLRREQTSIFCIGTG